MRLEYVNWSHLTDLVPDRVKDHREVLQVSVQVPGGVLVVSREDGSAGQQEVCFYSTCSRVIGSRVSFVTAWMSGFPARKRRASWVWMPGRS